MPDTPAKRAADAHEAEGGDHLAFMTGWMLGRDGEDLFWNLLRLGSTRDKQTRISFIAGWHAQEAALAERMEARS